jgi:plasmid stabilization system protein ParE
MTYTVIVQPPARRDMEAAYRYIHERAPRTAEHWFAGLEKAIASLDMFPNRCGIASESREFDETIRQLLYGKRKGIYRVLFVVRDDTVRILHVRHGARRPMSRDEIEL